MWKTAALGLSILCFTPAIQAQQPKVSIEFEHPIQNGLYPELLYWFVTPQTLAPERYKQDIQHIAHDTVFDFPFLTERNGVTFLDSPPVHAAIADLVRNAHANGLKIGATIALQSVDTLRKFPLDDDQAVVSEAEQTLDANGHAELQPHDSVRYAPAQKTELLRVFVFRKTLPDQYDPKTFEDVTASAKSLSSAPGTISVTLNLGSRYAGYTAYAMSTTWFNALDLFSDAYPRWVQEAVNQYRDIPLDGTALDEFGYMKIPMKPIEPFRGHFAGHGFTQQFEKTTGMPLTQTIFNTRYAPSGHPEVRIKAIDIYWDFLRQGPLRVEQEFYNDSRQAFGARTFAGIHNTFHNHLTNDEAWATGLNWWTIPRQYGQSDEDLSLPLRMGLLISHPGKIMYDQFYGSDIHRFATKAMNDARFNARLHYHGYNDTGRWGVDLSTAPFLSVVNPVEQKIRLLNRFDPAAPALPLLVVFGMPSLLNWVPNLTARNEFDVNGSLHIEEKVAALWNAGYRLAVLPSDLIDNGALTLDAHNRPVINGHTFRAIVYLYPEYAKPATLKFLDRYTQSGGALMLEGEATRGFDGQPLDNTFRNIAARARVQGFSIDAIARLGIDKDPLRDIGASLEDGSVILTDLASEETAQPRPFSLTLQGHQFSGAYIGVFALKAAPDGHIQKLACGQCKELLRDGHPILELATAADFILTETTLGNYTAIVNGLEGRNTVTLQQ